MFDDKPLTGGQGQVPGNLPTSEPEDILSGTDDSAAATPDTPVPAAPSTALGAGVLKPKAQPTPEAPAPQSEAVAPTPAPVAPQAPVPAPVPAAPAAPIQAPPTDKDIYMVKEPVLSKGLMAIIITAVVLGIIGGGGWLVYVRFIAPDTGDELFVPTEFIGEAEEEVFEEEVVTEPEEEAVVEEEVEEITDAEILFGDIIDSDNDNLDDSREEALGTDPNKVDTDSDGIGDGEEVIVWGTDPLKADTDGDGYLDGEEIKAGFNPLGEGSLFEPPTIVIE